ncbi:MAG: SpoIIE family protein phosphatase [Methanobacteriaceae archaeon]|nr:SpoIIE family protein phosphatase [Methanobacteriaceae archaeon]
MKIFHLKHIIVSFSLFIVVYLFLDISNTHTPFGVGLNPYLGLHSSMGLLFGVYGGIGTVLANLIIGFKQGYASTILIPYSLINIMASYLPYKLWYTWGNSNDTKQSIPSLSNIHNIIKFILILMVTSIIYSLLVSLMLDINIDRYQYDSLFTLKYLLNTFNFSFIFGVIGITVSNRLNIGLELPTINIKRKYLNKLYKVLFIVTSIMLILSLIIFPKYQDLGNYILYSIIIFLLVYLTKPVIFEIQKKKYQISIIEDLMLFFLVLTLILFSISGVFAYLTSLEVVGVSSSLQIELFSLLFMDIIVTIFFIPTILILNYVEKEIVKPIIVFSKATKYVKTDEKINTDKIIEDYSKYINKKNEIGTLSNAYIKIAKDINKYILNLQKITKEQERIQTELKIAEKIQKSILPINFPKNNNYQLYAYSKPAKEVGGDFYDFFNIDDETIAIIIADASGKGIPGALFSVKTQALIKSFANQGNNPDEILYKTNNQLCENNEESMFVTLWLGLYNINSHELIYSNAGHNPPLIKEKDNYHLLKSESNLVLGVFEDIGYEHSKIILEDTLILYTDGITEANNKYGKFYQTDNLIKTVNNIHSKNVKEITEDIMRDVNKFMVDIEQFDDITLLILSNKK